MWKISILKIFVQYPRFEVRRDVAYNPVTLDYNHVFQPFKTTVLPFHERSESDYDSASHRKITKSYFIDCFPGNGIPPSQLHTKLDSNMTHLTSKVRNRNRPGCAQITGASSPGQLNFVRCVLGIKLALCHPFWRLEF
jgi:hypothetical protein